MRFVVLLCALLAVAVHAQNGITREELGALQEVYNSEQDLEAVDIEQEENEEQISPEELQAALESEQASPEDEDEDQLSLDQLQKL